MNNKTKEVVHTPPQSKEEILYYLDNLMKYINDNDDDVYNDPLIKLALIHYQFESIHPFYDGNGRTGRILNILYLTFKGLLDTPILYLSKYIIKNKIEYYNLFQETRKTGNYEDWIIYILKGIEEMSNDSINMINKINDEMYKTKQELQENIKFYSKELLEALYYDFCTKLPYIQQRLNISDRTAQKYLDTLVKLGFLTTEKIGRERIYRNERLFNIIKEWETEITN
jgi:Fic family protein